MSESFGVLPNAHCVASSAFGGFGARSDLTS